LRLPGSSAARFCPGHPVTSATEVAREPAGFELTGPDDPARRAVPERTDGSYLGSVAAYSPLHGSSRTTPPAELFGWSMGSWALG
jgi:hypothetical protein